MGRNAFVCHRISPFPVAFSLEPYLKTLVVKQAVNGSFFASHGGRAAENEGCARLLMLCLTYGGPLTS